MMRNRIQFIIFVWIVIGLRAQANDLSIIPYPNSVVTTPGRYTFDSYSLSVGKGLESEVIYLKNVLREEFDVTNITHKKKGNIQIALSSQLKNDEAYRLQADKEGVRITASSPKGIFYGIQTFRQLLQKRGGKLCMDYVCIEDAPAFKWRAFMLDDARAFKGVEEVKRLLDEMSILKMNVFHWHLTEDQGWRIEIKKYPRLTQVGAIRDSTQLDWYESKHYDGKPLEGYYTQEQVKDIVRYAADRHITIVPEIEMPGHASAAIAAYPWLGNSGEEIKVPCFFGVQADIFNVANPKVLAFFRDVLDEVMELFPSKVIHIGGDEVKYDQWNTSAEVQAFMKEKQINTPAELQIWFTNYISGYLHSKGRRIMGWNDVTGDKIHGFQGEMTIRPDYQLSSDAVVQFWTGDSSLLNKAAERGYDIVNSLHEYTYLNYNHDKITPGLELSFAPIPLSKAYSFTPIPKGFPDKWRNRIIGLGCQMWGEWIPTVESMNKMIYPYWAAHAETGWTQESKKDYTRFVAALRYFITRWVGKGYLSVSDKWVQQQNRMKNKFGSRMREEELTTAYITPKRIVWMSDSTGNNIKYSEKLLVSNSGQTYVNMNDCFVMDSHHGVELGILLDFGKELHGGLQISTTIRENTKPIKVRLRFGESVSEAMTVLMK